MHGAENKSNGNCSRNFKREYCEHMYTLQQLLQALTQFVLYTASDFSVGECWGYKKFFDLTKLVGCGSMTFLYYAPAFWHTGVRGFSC